MKVLILDNYDSFVYNIAQYVGALGAEPMVVRNDEITFEQAKKFAPDRIIISPGPGHPANPSAMGVCSRVIREMGKEIPTLGVCLGHQGIAQVFGGRVDKASKLMHGKPSRIVHDGKGILEGLPSPLKGGRYHSLTVQKEQIPEELKVTALALEDAEVMGVRHRRYPIEGVQFHPESVMTADGMKIMRNFIEKGVRH